MSHSAIIVFWFAIYGKAVALGVLGCICGTALHGGLSFWSYAYVVTTGCLLCTKLISEYSLSFSLAVATPVYKGPSEHKFWYMYLELMGVGLVCAQLLQCKPHGCYTALFCQRFFQ